VTGAASLPVSVIIPCHDAEHTIERALASVAAQSRPPAEVIIVDDSSTDDTRAIVQRSAQRAWPFALTSIVFGSNQGPAAARNAGWAAIAPNAAYVAFLDADDVWLPRKLERQIAWMEGHQDVAWTAHRCDILAGERTRRPDDAAPARGAPITMRGLLVRNAVATPTVVVRASVRSRFRVGWRHCEDLMLWLDWLDEGARGVMLDLSLAALGRVPGTAGGSTGDLAAMYRGERRVLRTLVIEARISALEAAAWQGYAWLRYQRRRLRG